MAKCSLCGVEDLSYTCPYCHGSFCGEHRMPEGHGCPALHMESASTDIKLEDVVDPSYEQKKRRALAQKKKTLKRRRRKSRFSKTETRDLTIASILVILVGISIMGFPISIFYAIERLIFLVGAGYGWFPVMTITIFLTTFMAHEMAHKFTAQRYGMWSEFRMTGTGYYLSGIAILLSFPIFGTGVVYTSKARNQREDAITNMAGPLINMIIAGILVVFQVIMILSLSMGQIYSSDPLYLLFIGLGYGIKLNAMLGLFNMIPIQPFDGGTVFAWDKRVWGLLAVCLLLLLIFGYVI